MTVAKRWLTMDVLSKCDTRDLASLRETVEQIVTKPPLWRKPPTSVQVVRKCRVAFAWQWTVTSCSSKKARPPLHGIAILLIMSLALFFFLSQLRDKGSLDKSNDKRP
jgi:hypothetical protein